MPNLRSNGWIPDQHGAWPMALLPITFGIVSSGPSPIHALLTVAWFAAFGLFNAVELWTKTARKRRSRVIPAIITWGALTAAFGIPLLIAAPQILVWAPYFLPLVAIAAWGIFHGKQRALTVRATTVLASCLMTPVAYGLGALGAASQPPLNAHFLPQPGDSWLVAAVLAAYFLGTVPYVRSLIRGRRDPRWVWGTLGWHVASGAGIAWAWWVGLLHWSMLSVWLLLTIRGVALPLWQRDHKPLRPAFIGITEMLICAVVALSLALR